MPAPSMRPIAISTFHGSMAISFMMPTPIHAGQRRGASRERVKTG